MATEEHAAVQPVEDPAIGITPDVIEQILLRLPVSSLLRFRRVCKQWCNMINDPHFIREHALRAPKHLLLFYPKFDISIGHRIRNTFQPNHAMVINEKWSPATYAASHIDPDDHLFASCNGLLCFFKPYVLKIANPATGHYLYISKPDGVSLYDLHYLYSFGFHPVTGEYKLLHFLCEPQHYKSGRPFHFDIIQVYTLGDSKWRCIRTPRKCCMVNLGVVNVDGAMYWLTEDEGTSCGMSVVSFDLREETFTLIQLPPLIKVKETAFCATPTFAYYIAEIDNMVCTVAIPYQSHVPRWRRYNAELFGRMEIWALESQVEHKWFLKYRIQSPTARRYVPQPCFIYREKIVLQDRHGNAWYHDLPGKNVQIEQREEVKLLSLGACRFYETQSYFYKETLVPLTAYAGAAIVRSSRTPVV